MKLLRAARLLTGRPGEIITDGEVLIDGKTIVGVGPRGSLEANDAEIREFNGGTILPGLIDSHVHIGFDRTVDPHTGQSKESTAHRLLRMAENCRKLLSAGVTTARDLGCHDFIDVTLRDAIEEGIAVGPHLVVATRPITNSGGHCWYMGGEADDEGAIRRVARENLRAGADCLKIMATGGAMTPVGPPTWSPQFSIEQLQVAVEEAHLRNKHIAAHAHGTEGIRRAAIAGVTTIEHCSFRTGPELQSGEAPQEVIEAILNNNVFVCPTVSGMLTRRAEQLGPAMVESRLQRLGQLRDAGVKLIAGTDSGFGRPGSENRMDDYISGLEVFASAGFSNDSVIEMATILAAQAIGIGEVAGSLEVGKRADLIAVGADPLSDLANLRDLQLVLVSGREVTQKGIETTVSSGALD